MFCVSYGKEDPIILKDILNKYSMIEIRLDLMRISKMDLLKIINSQTKVILKDMIKLSDIEKIEMMTFGIENGAKFIDLDFRTHIDLVSKFKFLAKKNDCNLIISYHNEEETPDIDELEEIIESAEEFSPDYIKIACKVNFEEDNAKLLSLYSRKDLYKRIIPIGMGTLGRITRVASEFVGAPFTYVSWNKESMTAEGQFDHKSLKKIIDLIEDEY
jgi:3-dehydroquinate dehydratase type I